MLKKRSRETRACVSMDAEMERARAYCMILQVTSPNIPEIQTFLKYRNTTEYGIAKKVITRSAIAMFANRRLVVFLRCGFLKMT